MTLPLNASDRLVYSYFEAQRQLFSTLNAVLSTCHDDVNNATNTDEYHLAQNLIKSITWFEQSFGEVESRFWNYISESEAGRQALNSHAVELGYENQLEHMLAELGLCHQWIDDISTEINAFGYSWPIADHLTDQFWEFIDATESLIEAAPTIQLSDDLTQLISKIPPQKLAPIEVEARDNKLAKKYVSRGQTSVLAVDAASAYTSLRQESRGILDELSSTNCDRRYIGIFERMVAAFSDDFERFSVIELGLAANVVERTTPTIRDEVADISYERVLANIVNVRIFLSHFHRWQKFNADAMSSSFSEEDRQLLNVLSDSVATDPLFADDIKESLKSLCEAMPARDLEEKDKSSIHAFTASLYNVCVGAAHQALKYLAAFGQDVLISLRKDAAKLVGAAALLWIVSHSSVLLQLAKNSAQFGWLKPIIDYITKAAG